jgi:mitochondrial inner membrane protease subunit SOM1
VALIYTRPGREVLEEEELTSANVPVSISPSNRLPAAITICHEDEKYSTEIILVYRGNIVRAIVMAPPVEIWSASGLPDRVQVTMKGRLRKDRIQLKDCELLEMLQYECAVQDGRRDKEATVICGPVERLFRRLVS